MTQFTCKGVKQINNRISFKHLYHSYLSAFFISAGDPNGEFPEILIAKCRSRFYCTWFFCWGGDRAGGKGVCGRLMSPAHETQSMREIRLLRGRLLRKGGGLTGMSLKQQSAIDMSPHSDTLSWFRINQSLLFLLNAVFLVEKQEIPIL
jgi:hypothetical protein